MAVLVVDRLEVIEVDEQCRKYAAIAPCKRDVGVGAVEKSVAAEQAGQGVETGEAAHLFLDFVDSQ